jgi:hypothetical protein
MWITISMAIEFVMKIPVGMTIEMARESIRVVKGCHLFRGDTGNIVLPSCKKWSKNRSKNRSKKLLKRIDKE